MVLPISVIIVAHDRETYLEGAIRSVLDQDISRDDYEVIVVKNFRNERIDSLISENGLHSIVTDVQPVGGKFSLGVEKSRGEVLCFLEDDDLFASNKLRTVKELFTSDSGLVFYHNSATSIDQDMNEIKPGFHPELPKNEVYRNSLEALPRIDELTREKKASLNMSCMSVRHHYFIDKIEQFRHIRKNPDGFTFLTSISQKGSIVVGKDKLTAIRIHQQSMSRIAGNKFSEINSKRGSFVSDLPHDNTLIYQALPDTPLKESFWNIDSNLWVDIEAMLYGRSSNRRKMFQKGKTYMKEVFRKNGSVRPLFFAIFLSYLVMPAAARLLYGLTVWVKAVRQT